MNSIQESSRLGAGAGRQGACYAVAVRSSAADVAVFGVVEVLVSVV